MRKNLQHIQLNKGTVEADQNHPEHVDFGAGFAPYLRGINASMYTRKPWEIKQYNSIDSSGINNMEDMKTLLYNKSHGSESVCIDIDKNVLPVIAFLIAGANEEGTLPELLSGTLKFDIYKIIESDSTPTPTLFKTLFDILEYNASNIPNFCEVTLSGSGLQEAGTSVDIELAYTLAFGLEYIRAGVASGQKVDDLAQRLRFSWSVGMEYFTEVAKMRAARMLWAKLMKQFNPKDEKSLAMHIHSQTSISSLAETDPYNNVGRICTEAFAAAFGGSQSLETFAYDQATGQPSETGTQLAYNTQLFLQEETKITKTADPWAGSNLVESLTDEITQKTWKLIEEIEASGGFLKFTETGTPQQRINDAIALKQAQNENGEAVVVGVNKYKYIKDTSAPYTSGENKQPQATDLKERNIDALEKALNAIVQTAQSGNGNLLALVIEAARNGATTEEINSAINN